MPFKSNFILKTQTIFTFKLKSKVTIVHKDKHVSDGPRYRSAPVSFAKI